MLFYLLHFLSSNLCRKLLLIFNFDEFLFVLQNILHCVSIRVHAAKFCNLLLFGMLI